MSACVSQSTYHQQVRKTSACQKLDEQLKAGLAGGQAKIEQLQNLVELTPASGMLFAEGGWELYEAGKSLLAKRAPALKGRTVHGAPTRWPISSRVRACPATRSR